MAHDVFISHSTNNRPIANAVCASLESVAFPAEKLLRR